MSEFLNKFLDRLANKLADIALEREFYLPVKLRESSKIWWEENIPVSDIGVQVDGHSKNLVGDTVLINILFKNDVIGEDATMDLYIDEAERLARLLQFQCKVARLAQKKKRQTMNIQAATERLF